MLLTLVRPQAKGAVQSARKTLEESGIPVFKAEIRNLAVFERTPLQGVLVKDMKEDKAKTAWQDYYAMKEELGL